MCGQICCTCEKHLISQEKLVFLQQPACWSMPMLAGSAGAWYAGPSLGMGMAVVAGMDARVGCQRAALSGATSSSDLQAGHHRAQG